MTVVHRPEVPSMPWRVILPNTMAETRAKKIAWCRANSAKVIGLEWIAPNPKFNSENRFFGIDDDEHEIWCFKEQHLAMMFELAWNSYD